MGNVSLWQSTAPLLNLPALGRDLNVDFCVIGGGIAGLSTAYELVPFGTVAVVTDRAVGEGMTGRTTAHISNALDDRYSSLERMLGGPKARLAAESHTAAIDRIARIVHDEGIACDFQRLPGYLFLPPGEKAAVLEDEFDAASRAGVKVERAARAPFVSWDTGPALCFPDQAQFHPVKYLTGLAAAIQRRGGLVFTGTRATSMKGGKPATVHTDEGHIIRAQHLIVTTNTPVNDRVVIHTKQASYTSSVVALRCKTGSIPHVLLWDTSQKAGEEQSYHYLRTWSDEESDLLIVGGEDYKTGQSETPELTFGRLEEWVRSRFPGIGERVAHWSGQVFEPLDGMAFIGRNPLDDDNVFVATGDSGNGITHGTIAGMLIRDLIREVPNPWEALYDPGRKLVKTLPGFLQENLNAAAQARDWLTAGDLPQVNAIEPGTGGVIRQGVHKFAVYRDEGGVVSAVSAVCPHLRCIVRWNGAEKSWDCPCHGSRFNAYGKVICGPANRNLESACLSGDDPPALTTVDASTVDPIPSNASAAISWPSPVK
jgi:glycine/D-amino acid oxidase-like deaminating enzyme/nitrite reductase/ring-hydroxylating ferredoxin subunit